MSVCLGWELTPGFHAYMADTLPAVYSPSLLPSINWSLYIYACWSFSVLSIKSRPLTCKVSSLPEPYPSRLIFMRVLLVLDENSWQFNNGLFGLICRSRLGTHCCSCPTLAALSASLRALFYPSHLMSCSLLSPFYRLGKWRPETFDYLKSLSWSTAEQKFRLGSILSLKALFPPANIFCCWKNSKSGAWMSNP